MHDREAAFVEDVALFWERQGLPRIAGRILGWLFVCSPPHRSSTQLAADLGVSKGSISSMTRLLLDSGSIEIAPIPGSRATFFRLSSETLERKLSRRIEAMLGFGPIARQGHELVEDRSPQERARLQRAADLYAFLERELPALLERWHQEHPDG